MADKIDLGPEPWVAVPRLVIERAFTKARILYLGIAAAQGTDPGPDDECWAEFERLNEFLEQRP